MENYIVLDNSSISQAANLLVGNLGRFEIYGETRNSQYNFVELLPFLDQIECLNNFLTGIVFFDCIKQVSPYMGYFRPPKYIYKYIECEFEYKAYIDERYFEEKAYETIKNSNYEIKPDYVRSLMYFYISNFLGLNYLLTPSRSDFLRTIKINDLNNIIFQYVDKKVKEDISNFNKSLGSELFSIHIPVLLNYIITQVNSRKDILDAAISIRESRGAKLTRNWLNDINSYIIKGNLPKLAKEIKAVDEVMHEFSKDIGIHEDVKMGEISMDLNLIPTISIPLEFKIPRIIKKRHVVFLSKLIKSSYTQHISESVLHDFFMIEE